MMNVTHRVFGLALVFSAIGLAACEEPAPQKDMAAEQKAAQEKIAKAEKEAADKAAAAKREAEEKVAKAEKELAEKKAEVKKDLAEELADKKYEAFTAMNDYKAFVATRIDQQEKRLADLKTKAESTSTTMTADAKKEWNEKVKAAEADLKAARAEMATLDKSTDKTWAATKAKVDAAATKLSKSVDDLGNRLEKKI